MGLADQLDEEMKGESRKKTPSFQGWVYGKDSDVIYKGINGKLDYGESGCVPVLTYLVFNSLETSKRRHPASFG